MKIRIGFCVLAAVLFVVGITQSASVAAGSGLPAGFARVLRVTGINQPTAFAFQGENIFVAQKEGRVRIVNHKGKIRKKAYLKLAVSSDKERGLLGVAIDPKYNQNGYVYVYYTTAPGAKKYGGHPMNRVSRFTTENGRGKHETILLDNIPSDLGYHNGGDIHFGFDGKLYVSVGDGGLSWGSAHDLSLLSGKLLRINKNGSVPEDNPFYGQDGKEPRVYAYGFRNPFRFALRWSNETYIVGDVGNLAYEELDSIEPGGDYGWFQWEGPCLWSEQLTTCDPNATDFGTTVPPMHYYSHSEGAEQGGAIIAGAFPRNSNYPAPYNEALFYGDWGAGWVHALALDENNVVTGRYDFDEGIYPSSFAVGPQGNIFVTDFGEGAIYEYVYTP
jgi:glucose/arabinose dehydrogenase